MPYLKQRLFISMSPLQIGTLIQLDGSHKNISQAEFEIERRVDDLVINLQIPLQQIFLKQNNADFGILLDVFRGIWQNMTLQQFEQQRRDNVSTIRIDMPPQSEQQSLARKAIEPQAVKLAISVDMPKPVMEVQRIERDDDGKITSTVTDILY
jgi:hypothetical protein